MALVIQGLNASKTSKIVQLATLEVFPTDFSSVRGPVKLKNYWQTKYADNYVTTKISNLPGASFNETYGLRTNLPVTYKTSVTTDYLLPMGRASFNSDTYTVVRFTDLPKPKELQVRLQWSQGSNHYTHSGMFFRALSGDKKISYPIVVSDEGVASNTASAGVRINNNTSKIRTKATVDDIIVIKREDVPDCFTEEDTMLYEMVLTGASRFTVAGSGVENQPFWKELTIHF